MPSKFENRGDRRLHLKKPAVAFTSKGRIEIIDLSLTGLGVANEFPLTPGDEMFIEFAFMGEALRLWCSVAYCRPARAGAGFRSGLIVKKGSESGPEYKKIVSAGLDKLREAESKLPPTV